MNKQQVELFVRLAKQSHRYARTHAFGPTFKAWERGRRDAWMLAARHIQESTGARLRNAMRRAAAA